MAGFMVALVYTFVAWMWVSGIWMLLTHRLTIRSWSFNMAQILTFWGAILVVEAFWWFWDEGLIHNIAMGSGGSFGVFWGLVYIFKLRRKEK